jgi:hypothetical protein
VRQRSQIIMQLVSIPGSTLIVKEEKAIIRRRELLRGYVGNLRREPNVQQKRSPANPRANGRNHGCTSVRVF